MAEYDNSGLGDPAEEILVHAEPPSFVQLADVPVIDERPPGFARDDD